MIPTTKPFIVPDSFLDAIVTDPHWISITLLLKRWRTYVEGRESKDEKDEGRNFSHGTIARWSLVGELGLFSHSPKESGLAHANQTIQKIEHFLNFELRDQVKLQHYDFELLSFELRDSRFKIQLKHRQ